MQNDLLEREIKSRRKLSKRFLEFKKKLRLDPHVVTCDNQDISALQVAFEGEIILTQYCIENKRLDTYFSKYKFGIEVAEYNHESKNSNHEKSRQLIKESYGITIIRTNPDDADFDLNTIINQIYMHIITNHAIKMGCQKCFTKLQKMKNAQSEIKPIKIGKRPGTTYSLGVTILHIILGCKK